MHCRDCEVEVGSLLEFPESYVRIVARHKFVRLRTRGDDAVLMQTLQTWYELSRLQA
jgi:hypothetical protein